MNSELVIIGASGHAVSVLNVARSMGFSVIGCVSSSDEVGRDTLIDVPILSEAEGFEKFTEMNFAIAIGDNSIREAVYTKYRERLPLSKFPSLIHASVVIGINSVVGDGSVIMPLSNVGPNSVIGEFCIMNSMSSIDHDCRMAPFSSLAPRAVLGGDVQVGHRSAISIGACVKHGVKIGDDVVIGANSYVNSEISNNCVAFGTPCKLVRKRDTGERYL